MVCMASIPLGARSAEPAGEAAAVGSVRIQRFEIVGASAVPEAELQAALAPFLNTPVSRDDLTRAARTIERKYQVEYRLVARVTLPAQDITDGVVRLRVAEARFGKAVVQTGAAPAELHAIGIERAAAVVQAQQPGGALLNIDAVERATSLLNEWPGLSAQSSLIAGAQPGETDVALSLQDRRPWEALLRADTEGARATGRARLGLESSYVLPGGRGQVVGLGASLSEGSRLIRLSASAPLNERGWRASVYGSALDYRLVTTEFNSLDVKGPSDTLGANLSWAMQRSADASSDASAQFEHRRFNNQALGTTLSDYTIDVITLRWAAQADDPIGRSRTSGDLSLSVGRVDLTGSPNETADALTTRTAGRYAALRASVARMQAFSATQSASVRVSGQISLHNLDVSERLPIAGPAGVRAYPVGEATGSRGLLATSEWLQGLGGWGRPELTLAAFADVGVADQLVTTDFAGAPDKNRLRLAGAGLWLEWRPTGAAVTARLTVAQPIGAHPNPTPAGTNQDGSRIGTRWWASLQWAL